MGKKWIKLKEIGQLYLEKVIVTFDIPLLFVCNDFQDRKYLCLNVDDEAGTTLIAETDNRTLIAMLRDKITMESVFRNAFYDRIIVAEYDVENEEIITKVEKASNISVDLLPEKDAYLELSNEVILEYISFLDKQMIKVVVEKFSEKKSIIVQQKKFHAYFSSTNENIISCWNIKLADTKMEYLCGINASQKMIA